PPSRFYLLNPLHPSGQDQTETSESGCISIGIGPVELPRYLNRPQIITRINENELELAEFNKWAEPLDENISSVLVENITGLLDCESFDIYPWKGAMRTDYRVAIDIIRFDGSLSGNASLMVRWSIFHSQGRDLLTTKRSTYSEPVTDQSFKALVIAQEKMLAALSTDIAKEIRSIARPKQHE
ncbi:MAG TPA: membrane integrity-associated transporter subunit PqiC, partial [Deltaproteobacteria bacterium]|nr:membrane integrity-associated transporter subunit PqiC [Deltaproteobacteria bacterium]